MQRCARGILTRSSVSKDVFLHFVRFLTKSRTHYVPYPRNNQTLFTVKKKLMISYRYECDLHKFCVCLK